MKNNDIIAPLIKTTELFTCTHFMVAFNDSKF